MGIALRYNTASQEIALGHFVDDTDGKTAETGLTIANTDIKLWKNGATSLANKNSGGATHIAGGVYYAVLDATDTNTIGPMVIFVAVSGALAVRLECHVYPQQVFDSLFGSAGDLLQVDVAQFGNAAGAFASGRPEVNTTHAAGTAWNSGAIGASTLASDTITAAKIASNAFTSAKFAAGAFDAVWSVTARVLTANTNLNDPSASTIATAVRSELATELGRIDAAISTRLAGASYTAPANSDISAIKDVTDQMVFGAAGALNINVTYVNGIEVTGDGEEGTEWGPA